MATIFLIKIGEDTGVPSLANTSQLGLSATQLFIDSTTRRIKLSWKFLTSTTNLLDWIGMFESGKFKDRFLPYLKVKKIET